MANYYLDAIQGAISSSAGRALEEIFFTRYQHKAFPRTALIFTRFIADNEAFEAVCGALAAADVGSALVEQIRGVRNSEVGGGVPPDGNEGVPGMGKEGLLTPVHTAAIVAYSLVHYLQAPFRLDSLPALAHLPEVWLWDRERLSSIRDDVDVLMLQVSLLVLIRQTLAPVRRALSDDDVQELFHRLDVLLRDPGFFYDHLVTELVRYVRAKSELVAEGESTGNQPAALGSTAQIEGPLRSPGSSGTQSALCLPPRWEVALEDSIRSYIAPGHAVLNIYKTRIYTVLLRSLVDILTPGGEVDGYLSLLPRYSLAVRCHADAIGRIVRKLRKVFQICVVVNGRVFGSILSAALVSNRGQHFQEMKTRD